MMKVAPTIFVVSLAEREAHESARTGSHKHGKPRNGTS